MKIVFTLSKFALLLFLGFICHACSARSISITRSRLMMGHLPVNMIIRTSPDLKNRAIEAGSRAYEVAQELEEKISEYQSASEISCLNRNAGKRFCSISEETYEVLRQSLEISKKTASIFDIRFASLSPSGRKAPIRLSPNKAKLTHPDTRIGVSAIGKGFIIEEMIESLKREGFDEVLIDGGGDIQTSGGPWKVAIQIPGQLPGKISKSFEIVNQALATSGNYEQAGNVRDPRTLKKVVRSSSVSVIASKLTLANALTTAFYVMGEKKSITYLEIFPTIKIFWTDRTGKIRMYSETSK